MPHPVKDTSVFIPPLPNLQPIEPCPLPFLFLELFECTSHGGTELEIGDDQYIGHEEGLPVQGLHGFAQHLFAVDASLEAVLHEVLERLPGTVPYQVEYVGAYREGYEQKDALTGDTAEQGQLQDMFLLIALLADGCKRDLILFFILPTGSF